MGDTPLAPRTYANCRAEMLACLDGFKQAKARVAAMKAAELRLIKADRAAHPHRVGDREEPEAYDLEAAFANNPLYRAAVDERNGSQQQAIMWALAALVLQAGDDPGTGIIPR